MQCVANVITLEEDNGCCDDWLGKTKVDAGCLSEDRRREKSGCEICCVDREECAKLGGRYERVR